MIRKLLHYIRRSRYRRTHRMLPDISGGIGACGQDVLIYNLLNGKKHGTFVDIGANDGLTISNTLFFERELDWKGVAIEPIPSVFEKLSKNRKCHLVHGCVTTKPGKAKFIEVTGGPNMLSTLAIHNAGLTARRLRKNARRHNASIREIEVECFRLESLLQRFSITLDSCM